MKTIDAYVVLADGKLDLQKVYTEECVAAKDARIAELEAHCKRLGAGDAERYWEGRWRDADAELSRIVAAKDAEIARLCKLAYIGEHQFEDCTYKFRLEELRAKHSRQVEAEGPCQKCVAPYDCSIDGCSFDPHRKVAQPARQVGGDEREQFEAWAQRNGISITRTNQSLAFANGQRRAAGDYILIESLCAHAAWMERAALATAAVVMPERMKIGAEASGFQNGKMIGFNSALDEVARLNRSAMPVELLKRIVAHADRPNQLTPGIGAPNHSHKVRGKWDQDGAHCDICADWDQLRALLGKG